MDQSACKMTLIVPTTAEDHIVELLLNSDPPITGFTSWAAEGHGHDFNDATASERVRGRVKRRAIVAVMTRARADRHAGGNPAKGANTAHRILD